MSSHRAGSAGTTICRSESAKHTKIPRHVIRLLPAAKGDWLGTGNAKSREKTGRDVPVRFFNITAIIAYAKRGHKKLPARFEPPAKTIGN
jgi:hypothetical protein